MRPIPPSSCILAAWDRFVCVWFGGDGLSAAMSSLAMVSGAMGLAVIIKLDTCLEEVFVNLFLVHILHTPWLWVPAWTTIGLIKYHAWTPFMSEAFSALTYNTWWYEYINSKIWNKKLPLCPSIGGLSMNGQRRSLGLLIIDFFGILDPPLVIKRPWHWP